LRAEFLKDPEKSELDIRYKLESAIRNAKNKYKYDRFTSIDDIYITYEVTKCKNDIQDSEGNHITKEQLISSVHVEVKTKTQGRWDIKYETASTCFNAPQGVEVLDKLDQIIDEAVNRSYAKIYAKELKTTNVNVLMDGSVASVFIHEIVGHLAEADSILAGDIFRDKYKQKIGPSFLTIKDVPFIENGFGNCIYDDEGVEGREVTLVKNGIVNDFLNDRTTAVKLNSYGYNVDLTGNGRANLSVPRPLPRMRNTILEPGTKSHEELLNELGTGIYLANTTGGKVNKKGGNFVIHIDEAYWVENGKIKYPVKVTHLAGNALIALNSIAALGDSSTLKTFSGVCGRSSDTRWCPIQHVYVSSRSPAILFSCLEIDGPKSSNYDEYITSDIIGKMLI
jgi:predicted Zn-dependent protease